MGKKIDPTKHRAAIDCTFNAPKSVSLQALVAGDERLIEAHRTAVERTLALMETRYAHSRIAERGQPQRVVSTGKLAIAAFDHIETRDLDPHLHTHCVVMNVTPLADGRWRSLHNDAIYRQQKLIGMVYQHELALEVQKLGYEVVARGHGQFEIAGFVEKDLENFSKRRQTILALAGENATVKERNRAWNNTRVKKETVEPETLKARWREEAAGLGVKFVSPALAERALLPPATLRSRDRFPVGRENNFSEKTLDDAIEHCSERGVAFPREDLVQESNFSQKTIDDAIEHCSERGVAFPREDLAQESNFSQKTINDAIEHCSERGVAFRQEDLEKFLLDGSRPVAISRLQETIAEHGELIKIAESTGTRYTTEAALQRELATIRMMRSGKGQAESILSKSETTAALESIPLTSGQHEAIATALNTVDRVIAWQGVAGAGKTYALDHFSQLARGQGYQIRGFAPSAEAAKVLSSSVGIEADTVAGLLCSKAAEEIQPDRIWIVDEAGLLSAAAAHDLLKRAEAENARVLLVGDTRQLSAVVAGNPFNSLQSAGMTTAFLNQSLRQRTAELQVAVDLIAKGEIDTGFERLNEANCLIEVSEEDKIERIVTDYLAVPTGEREKTLVLAGTNRERLAITDRIREGLRQEGQLGRSIDVTQLKSKDLTKVQTRYTHHIEVGDLIAPHHDYKKRRLKKGQFYEVIGKTQDSLTLKDNEGNTFTVDSLFEKSVYGRETIEVAEGDRLKWTKNDREKGRRDGQEFRVRSLEGSRAAIESKDGEREEVDFSQPQHLDHALVSTTYDRQGKTAERVLVSADNTIAQESFYVAVSRVKSDLKLYTTDKEELLERAKSSRAKENPLELLRHRDPVRTEPESEREEVGAEGKEVGAEGKEVGAEGKEEARTVSTPVRSTPSLSVIGRAEVLPPVTGEAEPAGASRYGQPSEKPVDSLADRPEREEVKEPSGEGIETDTELAPRTGQSPDGRAPTLETEFPSLNEERERRESLYLTALEIIARIEELLDFLPDPDGTVAFESECYRFNVASDYGTIELYALSGRGLIFECRDGRFDGALTDEDVRELQSLAWELEKVKSERERAVDELEL